MKITAKILRTNTINKIDLKPGTTVNILLEKLKLKPDTVIVMKENTPIPIDQELEDRDLLTIIKVSSGG